MNYILVGEESYNIKKRINSLISSIVGDDNPMAIDRFNSFDGSSVLDVVDSCQTLGFFSEKRIVIFETSFEALTSEQLESLFGYLKQPNDNTTFIIVSDKAITEKSELGKAILPLVKYEAYPRLSEDEFNKVVNDDLKDNKVDITASAKQLLLTRLPLDLNNWQHELNKLAIYQKPIDVEQIKELISRPLQDDVYELSNAILNKEMSKALSVLRDLMVNNKNDVLAFIGLLASQFRTMSIVKSLLDSGANTATILEKINSKSEYRVKMVTKSIGKLKLTDILTILNELAELDQKIKTGFVDGQVGLELFIIDTCRR